MLTNHLPAPGKMHKPVPQKPLHPLPSNPATTPTNLTQGPPQYPTSPQCSVYTLLQQPHSQPKLRGLTPTNPLKYNAYALFKNKHAKYLFRVTGFLLQFF